MSFNGNKIVTSGGGGAIITNDEEIAKHAKFITTTAKVPHPFEYRHSEVGYNYRLPNLNAALLVAQLENLELFLKSKRELAMIYKEYFSKFDDVKFIDEPAEARSNFWLNAVLFESREKRDEFLKFRSDIRLFIHLIDARHFDLDIDVNVDSYLKSFLRADQKILNLYTKSDKLNQSQKSAIMKFDPSGILVSTLSKSGIDKAREAIINHALGR